MSDSTRSGGVGGETAAWAPEAVVERDAGGEEALAEAHAQAVQRVPWRSSPSRSLQVQKIDSMRWRIGAKCGAWPDSSRRGGRMMCASSAATAAANARLT